MKRKVFNLLIVFLFTGCAFENSKIKEVDELLREINLAGKFDGTLTVGNRDGIIYEKALGLSNREGKISMKTETRLDIASINKSFQAYMILQLEESQLLSLDDPLEKHLPYSGPFASEITIHQMLTHTSGIGSYEGIADSLQVRNFEPFKRMYFSPDEYIEFISGLDPVSGPGEQFYYSNFAYHLLALIIEEKTGMHFSQALDSMICKPLNLSETYSPVDNYTIYERVADSYVLKEQKYEKSPFIDYSLGRRIFSTSDDLILWAREIISPTLVDQKLVDRMLTNHVSNVTSDISYGYGWAIFDGKGDYKMGKMDLPGNYFLHGGATDGYRSLLTIYNDGEWIIGHLSNIGSEVNELKLTEKILKILIE